MSDLILLALILITAGGRLFGALAVATLLVRPSLAVRLEGANHQWRKNPPGELLIDPVADERLVRVTVRVGAS